MIDESKNVQTTPTRTYCKRSRPVPYCIQNCRRPTVWITVGQGPTALPVCAGGGCLDIFLLLSILSLSSFSLSLGDGPI